MSENTITLSNDDVTANALVVTIKAAVNGEMKYAAYVEAHGVTRETVSQHAAALAAFAYPNERPVQRVEGKRTKFGNAVQQVGAGLRRALAKDEDNTEDDSTDTKDVKYLTAAGCKVENLADVLAKVEAEWTAAHSA